MPYSKSKNLSLIDEFESVFEAAARPEFDIQPVPLERILAVYDRSERAAQAARTAQQLAARFGAELVEAMLAGAVAPPGRTPRTIEGDASRAIEALVAAEQPQLVVLPCPFVTGGEPPESHSLGGVVDELVGTLPDPFLLVRTAAAERPFEKLLVYVPGTIGVEREFSLAFQLVAEGGRLELYHVVDQQMVETAAAALEVVSTIETEVGRQALVEGLRQKVHQLLQQAAEAARDLPFDLATCIEQGDPIERARAHVAAGGHGTVVLRIRPGERVKHDALSEELARELDGLHVLVV